MNDVIKHAYSLIPFKRQLFHVARSLVTPPPSLYQHLHFRGDFSVSIDQENSFRLKHYGYELENTIFWAGLRGGWEASAIHVWIQVVQGSRVVLDVGANTGIYSLIAKCLNPEATVYAIEPINRVYKKLVSNAQLNNFDIECREFAASDRDGMATIHDCCAEHTYSSTFHSDLFENETFDTVEVRVERLETFIRENNISEISLVKIDVEGHEPATLRGMGPFLHRFRPSILIEILRDEIGREVEDLIDGCGYTFFYISEESGRIERVQNLVRRESYNYLLATEDMLKQPRVRTFLMEGRSIR